LDSLIFKNSTEKSNEDIVATEAIILIMATIKYKRSKTDAR